VATIQQNRWDQLIRRVAGLIGPGSKVNNTIGDLFPMLDVENLPGELYLLAGTKIAYGGRSVLGAAGQFPRFQLFNPVDSGVIATITSITVATTTAQEILLTQTTTAESTDSNNQRVRDFRVGLASEPTCILFFASEAAALGATLIFRLSSNVTFRLTDPNGICVLAPGTGLTVSAGTVATRMLVNFFWRERVAEQSELNF